MGCSIGLRGDARYGSLGGFFFLKFNDIRFKGFLTCANVISPAPRPDLENDLKQLDMEGLRPNTKDAERARTDIVFFSEIDAAATKKDLDNEIKNEANMIARLEKEGTECGCTEKDIYRKKRRLANLQADLENKQALQKRVEKMPYLFGQTLLSSGKAMNLQRKILDYAFVKCKDPQKDEPPFFNPQHGHNLPSRDRVKLRPQDYLPDSKEMYLSFIEKMEWMSTIVKDHWYFKKGRTTGVTTGICNGVETYLRLDDADTWEGTSTSEYSEEFVILNSPSRRGEKQLDFAQGDMGSLVVDAEGYAAGLLFAKIMNWCGPTNVDGEYVGAGIVTPLDAIQQDISNRVSWEGVRGSLDLAT
ncbi:MAG: hypothetical protein LQ351_003496 [Letrouitia transgressa]|nr:MAG: hypothetical protein LQ351_003496 [Letrouitia transgressa]